MSALPLTAEELLAALVAVESVNPAHGGPAGGEARLAERIESFATAWGLRTQRCPVPDGRFNLVVSCEVSPQAEWLLFDSHLDTVSTEGMTIPPCELAARDGRLYGRGACDTKGSGAAMLWALKEYARQPDRPRNAGVVFVVDEEVGMSGAQAFAATELHQFKNLHGIVVGEPTGLLPVVAHNGVLRWRSSTQGVAAHSANPSRGRSAIAAMLPVIAALEEDFIPLATASHPLTGRAAASINVIRGGHAVNIIPDHCEILCDRRLVPGEEVAAILTQRDQALAGLAVTHDRQFVAPPLPPALSGPLHAWLSPALVAAGINPEPLGAPYATNASYYAGAGAAVLVLGPGDIAQAHTKDEWLAQDQFRAAVSVYGAMLRLPV